MFNDYRMFMTLKDILQDHCKGIGSRDLKSYLDKAGHITDKMAPNAKQLATVSSLMCRFADICPNGVLPIAKLKSAIIAEDFQKQTFF